MSDIRKQDKLSVKELAGHLRQWQTMRDSVFRYLERDTLVRLHSTVSDECGQIHDSIRMEFSRLVLSQPRTYKDILWLKEQTSPYQEDKELHHAAEAIRPFFASLDSQPACRGNRQQILSTYRTVLSETIDYGIHCLADLTTFIKRKTPYSGLTFRACPISMERNCLTSRTTQNGVAHKYSMPPNGTTSLTGMP